MTDQGYEVDSAPDAATALACVKEQIYDAAILDFNLPDMNGVRLHRRLRQMGPGLKSRPPAPGRFPARDGLLLFFIPKG